jgi:hypothetical protein
LHAHLEQRKRSSEGGDKTRPISITIRDAAQLEPTLKELSRLKKLYGDLLIVQIAPEIQNKLEQQRSQQRTPNTTITSKANAAPSARPHSPSEETSREDAVAQYIKELTRKSLGPSKPDLSADRDGRNNAQWS